MKSQINCDGPEFKTIEEVKCHIYWRAWHLIRMGLVKAQRRKASFWLEGKFAEYPYDFFLGAHTEVIDVFLRDCDAQRKEHDRQSRCSVKGKKDKTITCEESCNNCPYVNRPDGERIGFRQGGSLSTEAMLEDGLDIPDSGCLYEDLENEERADALHEAIEQLPDALNQIALQLLEDEELSERTIAKIVGVCQKTVNNRVHKVYDVLAENLKDYR